MRRRLPEITVAAYLLLAIASWVWGLSTEQHGWHPAVIAYLVVWVLGALGLLLRRRFALALVTAFEWVAIFGWVDDPSDWGRFALQVALVLLLLSPPMGTYAPPAFARLVRRPSRLPTTLTMGAVLIWAVIKVASGDPAAAIPLTALALLFGVLLWTVERNAAGPAGNVPW
jgi:hypothetical protein